MLASNVVFGRKLSEVSKLSTSTFGEIRIADGGMLKTIKNRNNLVTERPILLKFCVHHEYLEAIS